MAYILTDESGIVGCFTDKKIAKQRITNEVKRFQQWCDSPKGDYLIDEKNRRCKVWLENYQGRKDAFIIRYGRRENGWGSQHRLYWISSIDLNKTEVDW